MLKLGHAWVNRHEARVSAFLQDAGRRECGDVTWVSDDGFALRMRRAAYILEQACRKSLISAEHAHEVVRHFDALGFVDSDSANIGWFECPGTPGWRMLDCGATHVQDLQAQDA